jgi:hypothetical protein
MLRLYVYCLSTLVNLLPNLVCDPSFRQLSGNGSFTKHPIIRLHGAVCECNRQQGGSGSYLEQRVVENIWTYKKHSERGNDKVVMGRCMFWTHRQMLSGRMGWKPVRVTHGRMILRTGAVLGKHEQKKFRRSRHRRKDDIKMDPKKHD